MNDIKNQHIIGQPLSDSRRNFLKQFGAGFGMYGLASLLNGNTFAANNSGLASVPHFPAKIKNVIYLFMSGGPSHLELLDYKPTLTKFDGGKLPDEIAKGQLFAFINENAKLLGTQFEFKQRGQSGMNISELFPHIASMSDEITLINSMYTEAFNHDPARVFINTGSQIPGRPSMGSWMSYGLGSENDDLPAFVVLLSGKGQPLTVNSWSSGFLPTVHQGVQFRTQGDPVLYVSNPKGIPDQVRKQSIDAVNDLNAMHYDEVLDPEIETRIAAYEMAYKMQMSVPELMDISSEPESVHEAYGTAPGKSSFANNCLLARRLVERGVRFVQLYHRGWDHHGTADGSIVYDLPQRAKEVDQSSYALIQDLKQRGLLDETLVIWGGEFGRTPMMQGSGDPKTLGRDHHPRSYSIWMAGGGIKKGFVYGKSDDFGYNVVEDPFHVHDLQATILHLMGIDHKKLTFLYQGREFRLTDVHGKVAEKILA